MTRSRSDKFLWDVVIEGYQKMYLKSEPKANFKKMMKTGETKINDFFMKYYLPDEKFRDIIEKMCKKYKLNKLERQKVEWEWFLGCAPTSVKKKTAKKKKTPKEKK